ncbi:MAG: hypothetical protein E6Q97_19225 [Desulfurellales bacterium]|nr:MAG: hypothetical protein E6Q97_19225 [Desulfurellales bacterium]
MTGYHIKLGYNSNGISDDAAWEALKNTAIAIADNPRQIYNEAVGVEGVQIPLDCLDAYRAREDLTLRIIDEGEEDREIYQAASGGGQYRHWKEIARRAFCRLLIRQMHAQSIEVCLTVS